MLFLGRDKSGPEKKEAKIGGEIRPDIPPGGATKMAKGGKGVSSVLLKREKDVTDSLHSGETGKISNRDGKRCRQHHTTNRGLNSFSHVRDRQTSQTSSPESWPSRAGGSCGKKSAD